MNKKIIIPLLIAGMVILVGGAAAGGFFYGKSYESNRASTIRNDFMRERGIEAFDPNSVPTGGMPGQNMAQNANQTGGNFIAGGMGRGASGEIKSIEGNTLTLTSGDTETVLSLTDTTTIVKYTTGSTADLVAGQQVMVIGERDADGNITAVTQVTILDASIGQPPAGSTP